MFGFGKQMFISEMMFFGCSLPSVSSLSATLFKCVSMTNQKCKVRVQIVNVNSDEPIFYCFHIKISNCSGISNNISDPYAKMCIPDVVKNLKFKIFNLISRTNKTRCIKWHEMFKCKCS